MFLMLAFPKVLSFLTVHTQGDPNRVNGSITSAPYLQIYSGFFSAHQICVKNWPIKYPRNSSNSVSLSLSIQLLGKTDIMLPDSVWIWKWRKKQSLCVPGHQSCHEFSAVGRMEVCEPNPHRGRSGELIVLGHYLSVTVLLAQPKKPPKPLNH